MGKGLRGSWLKLFCLLLCAFPASGQEASGLAPVFLAEEVLALRLEAPFTRVLGSRGDGAAYFPALVVLPEAQGGEAGIGVEVKTRGNFRNRASICRFPPLMLDFPRGKTGNTIFAGENRLKLVTHCQPRARYRQYVLLEYLAYRTLNLLSEVSLRVRLVELSYVDSESGRSVATEPGFLIESVESLAHRLALAETSIPRVRREWYDQEQFTQTALFQYLLGSVDWSALIGPDGEVCCHNIHPLQDPNGDFIALAHDFDMTGLVNPSYGSVPRQLGIRRLTQRLYRGGCPDPEILARTVLRFQERREAIRALFSEQPGLTESVRSQSLAYIDLFYDVINDSAALQTEILRHCE